MQIEKHAYYFGYMVSSSWVVGILWLVSYFLVGMSWMSDEMDFNAAYLTGTFKESIVV